MARSKEAIAAVYKAIVEQYEKDFGVKPTAEVLQTILSRMLVERNLSFIKTRSSHLPNADLNALYDFSMDPVLPEPEKPVEISEPIAPKNVKAPVQPKRR
jgi:hypothetical protein